MNIEYAIAERRIIINKQLRFWHHLLCVPTFQRVRFHTRIQNMMTITMGMHDQRAIIAFLLTIIILWFWFGHLIAYALYLCGMYASCFMHYIAASCWGHRSQGFWKGGKSVTINWELLRFSIKWSNREEWARWSNTHKHFYICQLLHEFG